MRILIVDDEMPARERLSHLVEDLQAGEVVGHAANGREALSAVEATDPDLVLLDIRMPGMDGLEVARHLATLESAPAVIFTTAYDDHALAAFETRAVDYLLKPIRRARLAEAIAGARRPTKAQLQALQTNDGVGVARTHISATIADRIELVPIEEVRYFRAEQKYVTVAHPKGMLLVEDSLSALASEFGDRFLRVHRNALVALQHIRTMGRDRNGHLELHLDAVPESIEVSRRMASAVRKVLKDGKLQER